MTSDVVRRRHSKPLAASLGVASSLWADTVSCCHVYQKDNENHIYAPPLCILVYSFHYLLLLSLLAVSSFHSPSFSSSCYLCAL